MTAETDIRLTPGRRLTQGVAHTIAGPVEITRGTAGLLAQSAAATFGGLRALYRKSQARKELRRELVEAGELVSREFSDVREAVHNLPQNLAASPASGRSRRRLVLAGVGVATLAGGAALFSVLRRSRQPEPSPLPPSVSVEPQP